MKGVNHMKNSRKSVLTKLMSAILFMLLLICVPSSAEASSKYISVEDYAKELAKELKLAPVEGEHSGYVNALIEKGIIKEGDFKSYKSDLTRGDCMVLINRADEYLYGDNLDKDLVQLAIDKRISDIGKAKKSKREDIAKAYLKGYMKGFSNGDYSTDRRLKVNGKFVAKDALNCIKMLRNESLRNKISPDGQLIRTTNLPKNADKYPYILASFPNEYYDGWKFMFEGVTLSTYDTEKGKWNVRELIPYEEYAYPFEIDKSTDIENFAELRKEMLDTWVEKARRHLELIFNVDYRTIDEEWVEELLKTDYTYDYWGMEENTRNIIEKYVKRMKDNKTIIESDKIAVDGSSLYLKNGHYHLRVYIRYRINSSKAIYADNEIYNSNDLLYTSGYPVCFDPFNIGMWKEHIFEIVLTDYEKGDLGVLYPIFIE